ncbi:MAG: hypothetical protein Q9174_002783 [Haloplaca sp. 1 TL-2023]
MPAQGMRDAVEGLFLSICDNLDLDTKIIGKPKEPTLSTPTASKEKAVEPKAFNPKTVGSKTIGPKAGHPEPLNPTPFTPTPSTPHFLHPNNPPTPPPPKPHPNPANDFNPHPNKPAVPSVSRPGGNGSTLAPTGAERKSEDLDDGPSIHNGSQPKAKRSARPQGTTYTEAEQAMVERFVRDVVSRGGKKRTGESMWEVIRALMLSEGVDKSLYSIRNYWYRFGREKSGFEERKWRRGGGGGGKDLTTTDKNTESSSHAQGSILNPNDDEAPQTPDLRKSRHEHDRFGHLLLSVHQEKPSGTTTTQPTLSSPVPPSHKGKGKGKEKEIEPEQSISDIPITDAASLAQARALLHAKEQALINKVREAREVSVALSPPQKKG